MTDAQGRRADGQSAAIHTGGDTAEAVDDEELVRQARECPDDPAAFAELYRRHLPRVYRYLVARLGDPHLAQDATAQTFLAALEGIGGYRGSGEFRAWLLMIAHNKAMDSFRARRATIPLEAVVEMPSSAPSPEQVVATRLQLEDVLRAMRSLSPDRAEALALRLFGGMSVAEVGAVMEKQDAAVKMLVFRALRDLRERLGVRIEAEP
ncbi:MAG TPA: sigma-70 family RNA polymerase sigma factor [Ktedonobacterales bacterium]